MLFGLLSLGRPSACAHLLRAPRLCRVRGLGPGRNTRLEKPCHDRISLSRQRTQNGQCVTDLLCGRP